MPAPPKRRPTPPPPLCFHYGLTTYFVPHRKMQSNLRASGWHRTGAQIFRLQYKLFTRRGPFKILVFCEEETPRFARDFVGLRPKGVPNEVRDKRASIGESPHLSVWGELSKSPISDEKKAYRNFDGTSRVDNLCQDLLVDFYFFC